MNSSLNRQGNLRKNLSSQLPKLTNSFWFWKKHYWKVYELPTGMQVINLRQMGLIVSKPCQDISKYIRLNNPEIIYAQLPNGKPIKVYPLSTAANYLRQLLQQDQFQLPTHRFLFTRSQWSRVMRALYKSQPSHYLIPNPCFFKGDYRILIAQPFQIALTNQIQLQILVSQSTDVEYSIEVSQGLTCIDFDSTWLTQYSLAKAKILSHLNISSDNIECRIPIEKGYHSVYALLIQDWFNIWEYFAKKGNKKAISILKACAIENIPTRIVI